MPEFNIVPEIGGIDTSDPSRLYSPEEQLQVVRALYGEGLKLPNSDEALYVGVRTSKGTNYGTETGKIFVPSSPNAVKVLLDGSWASPEPKSYKGFLAASTGAALNAGRLAYLKKEVTSKRQGTELVEKKHLAIKGIIAASGIDPLSSHIGLIELQNIAQWVAMFAGHQRGEIVTMGRIASQNTYILYAREIMERLKAITTP